METDKFESDVIQWHVSQGGFPGKPRAHALRALREMVELCVAAGAMRMEIFEAVMEEMMKAEKKGEFTGQVDIDKMLEEHADVRILLGVFKKYFFPQNFAEISMERKFEVCKGRLWQPDADGVLWRPGTNPSAPSVVNRYPYDPPSVAFWGDSGAKPADTPEDGGKSS